MRTLARAKATFSLRQLLSSVHSQPQGYRGYNVSLYYDKERLQKKYMLYVVERRQRIENKHDLIPNVY